MFRKHNIIEYKSPTDYLSIDDFYLVYGYACLYKADTQNVDTILANEITLSFVCHSFPQKLIQHLKKVRKYSIEKQEDGVYYVKGDLFPIQIIHTKELSKKENLWLKSLTDNIKDKDDILTLMSEYEDNMTNKLYSSVMNVIAKANIDKFREVDNMCEALEELFLEMHRPIFEQEKQQAVAEAVAEKDARIAELEALLAAKENK